MKASIILPFLFCSIGLFAQNSTNTNSADFELGEGLKVSLNDGDYEFAVSGMIQAYYGFQQPESQDMQHFLNVKRSYLRISGKAKNEKLSFMLQTDFSSPSPLLDAWLAYEPIEHLKITAGQKQSIANNREMLMIEDHLTYADRSVLSRQLASSGREFGLFVEYKIKVGELTFVPQAMVTSCDGKNSFGTDSRDVDFGGFKYGARLDIYPLGMFIKGNELQVADLAHEDKLRFVLGGAASYNDGASHFVGEGHGDFIIYNEAGERQLPDYRKIYGDILVKYKGFSFLGEYGIATATSLKGTFTDPTATTKLLPTEISQYLALGRAYNAQLGYVTKSGYAVDLSYAGLNREFDNNFSQLQDATALTAGFAKYFKDNSLKVQASYTNLNQNDFITHQGQIMVQVIF